MKVKISRFLLIPLLILIFSLPATLYANTMAEAARKAIAQLKSNGLSSKVNTEIVMEMVNYHSRKFDRDARIIQSELYSALQAQFPEVKILLISETLTGVSSRAVYIKGTYKPEGTQTIIELSAIEQMNGRLIAKANEAFVVDREKFENMVVVLPIEAPSLQKNVVKTFSKIFRSALTQTGAFNLVSSDIIDSVDADQIQEQYKCSREECSAIVAEQVNASQVITTQYNKISAGTYYLTASLKDIKTGRTIKEEAIQHDGNLETLPAQLNNLAKKLAEGSAVARPTTVLSKGTGMMVIKSDPSDANIVIDGRPIPEKTIALLQNIPIGKHTVMIHKGNLAASKEIILTADKTEDITLRLESARAELLIDSNLKGAAYLNGRFEGETPLIKSFDVGTKVTVQIKLENYITHEEETVIQPFIQNKINATLLKSVSLLLAVAPPGAWIKVDGDKIADERAFTMEEISDFSEQTITLPVGKHTIEAGHSQAAQNEQKTIELTDSGELYNEVIRLTMNRPFLNQLN
ncbi:PEGA domain-containing protein, partial [bacterium]|nr:PEGA domain-containing protein [bacterium]